MDAPVPPSSGFCLTALILASVFSPEALIQCLNRCRSRGHGVGGGGEEASAPPVRLPPAEASIKEPTAVRAEETSAPGDVSSGDAYLRTHPRT